MENLAVWSFTNQHGSHYASDLLPLAETYANLLNDKIGKIYEGLHVDVDRLKYTVNETDLSVKEFTNLADCIKSHIWYNS